MEYRDSIIINETPVDKDHINSYLDGLIGKVFAILGVYEDCVQMDSFDIFDTYTYRVMCELRGFYEFTGSTSFISLSSILEDVRVQVLEKKEDETLSHKRVKSLVFHCISIIKKERVE